MAKDKKHKQEIQKYTIHNDSNCISEPAAFPLPLTVDTVPVTTKCLYPFPPVPQPLFTFIDLFAGIGGFRIAMQRQGGKCVFSSEWDKHAQQTYYANYGELPMGDITDEKVKSRIPRNFDILCGGFPCQPFSIAGVSKKNSLGRAHGFMDKTQGTLFFDIVDILYRHRPKAFLLENVKNLISHDRGRTFKIITETLEELDYSIFYKVLDAQGYVPQHRQRIFIVGFDSYRYGRNIPFSFPKEPEKKIALKDILEETVSERHILSDKLWQYLQDYAEKHRRKGNGFGYGLANLDGISRTLSARYYKDGSEILIPMGEGKNPRRLSPRECARLMGYPDEFVINAVSQTQIYKQMGNSVVVPLVTDVAKSIVNTLKELDGDE